MLTYGAVRSAGAAGCEADSCCIHVRRGGCRDLKSLRQEISILKTLTHENIIALFSAFETDKSFCVITEFATGDLFRLLQARKRLTEREVCGPAHGLSP
jgi:serine/threonine protein kinase